LKLENRSDDPTFEMCGGQFLLLDLVLLVRRSLVMVNPQFKSKENSRKVHHFL
jgi:hypothetical protein